MSPKIIFDLSEVLIFGLVGVEKNLATILQVPEAEILKYFAGDGLQANVGRSTTVRRISSLQPRWV